MLRDGEKKEERVKETRTHTLPARADHTVVRRNNLELTLRLLALTPGLSRADLAGGTGLTRATVTRLVAELIELGLVREGTVSSVAPGWAAGYAARYRRPTRSCDRSRSERRLYRDLGERSWRA